MQTSESTYQKKVAAKFSSMQTVARDWKFTGNFKETRDPNGKPNGVCQMCDHDRIAYAFELATKDGRTMWVGSECVVNVSTMVFGYSKEMEQKVKKAKADFTIISHLVRQTGVPFETAQRLVRTYPNAMGHKNYIVEGDRIGTYTFMIRPGCYLEGSEFSPFTAEAIEILLSKKFMEVNGIKERA